MPATGPRPSGSEWGGAAVLAVGPAPNPTPTWLLNVLFEKWAQETGTGAVRTAAQAATPRGAEGWQVGWASPFRGVSGVYPPELGLEEAGGRGEALEGEHGAPALSERRSGRGARRGWVSLVAGGYRDPRGSRRMGPSVWGSSLPVLLAVVRQGLPGPSLGCKPPSHPLGRQRQGRGGSLCSLT